jgi:predicted enzyme related to lactoylglutathione lyase
MTRARHILTILAVEDVARNTGVGPVATPAGAIAPTELYLRVDDLSDAVGRLADAGARLLSPASPRDWGDTVAYLADLDGNVLAVAEPGREGGRQ